MILRSRVREGKRGLHPEAALPHTLKPVPTAHLLITKGQGNLVYFFGTDGHHLASTRAKSVEGGRAELGFGDPPFPSLTLG